MEDQKQTKCRVFNTMLFVFFRLGMESKVGVILKHLCTFIKLCH